MSWQATFTALLGPGLFAGATFDDWLGELTVNRFVIHPARLLRLGAATASSMACSLHRWLEMRRYGSQIAGQVVQPPLFVLGHWRSGTTHLHNLLACDDRFAAPNLFQVLYPHTFLTTEAISSRLMSIFLPSTRFGMDNVRMGWGVPYEDEFAVAASSFCSPYVTMAFPRRHEHYDKYLTLRNVPTEDIAAWRSALTTFLKKLTLKYQRPLILKSPPHTCRIKLLLELFPHARFVHIRRHPYAVFQSTGKMLSTALRFWSLQSHKSIDWRERVIRQYKEMYDVFFEERPLIPPGQFHEIRFEDLAADPIGQIGAAYKALDLPAFDSMEPQLRKYVRSLSGYQRNVFPALSEDLKDRLAKEWRRCFDAWGYSADVKEQRDVQPKQDLV